MEKQRSCPTCHVLKARMNPRFWFCSSIRDFLWDAINDFMMVKYSHLFFFFFEHFLTNILPLSNKRNFSIVSPFMFISLFFKACSFPLLLEIYYSARCILWYVDSPFVTWLYYSPILCHWFLSVPPKNIRKLLVSNLSDYL